MTQDVDTIVSQLRDVLCSLTPIQFEKLVVRSLEEVLDTRFWHARSGDQRGRDLATGSLDEFGISVEGKRYQRSLDISQLRGYIERACEADQDLDVWVIATTTEVQLQGEREIRRCGLNNGIGTEILDLCESGQAKLPRLLAAARDAATEFVLQCLNPKKAKKFRDLIELLAEIHSYDNSIGKNLLSAASFFDAIAKRMRDDLRSRMGNSVQSSRRFNQIIHDHSRFVEREAPRSKLDSWFRSRHEREPTCVLCGDEGVGKTWVVFDWLTDSAELEDLFPVVLTATDASSMTSLAQGIAAYIQRVFDKPSLEEWTRRVRRWLASPLLRGRILILFDGINERAGVNWRRILEETETADIASTQSYSEEQEESPVPTIMTCRSQFWEEHLIHLRGVRVFSMERYSDQELELYLGKVGRTAAEFQEEVLEMMRIPRICGLVIDRYPDLVKAGDISLDRLLLEDAKFHFEKNQDQQFSDQDFQGLLQRLASDALRGQRTYWSSDLQSLIGTEAADEILNDLKSRGVFVSSGPGRHKLESARLYLGLGLLLVYRLHEGDTSTLLEYREEIEQYLEAARGLDAHAPILAAAILGAISEPKRDSNLVTALLEQFSMLQNVDKRVRERVNGYFPAVHEELREMAERTTLGGESSRFTWKWIEQMYVNAARSGRSSDALEATCLRWVRLINFKAPEKGHPRSDGERRSQYVEKLLEETPAPGSFEVNGSVFHVIEADGIWRLRNLALTVISARRARISAEFFRDWVLTSGVSRFYMPWDSKLAWLGRFMDPEMIEEVLGIIEEMLQVDNEIWQEAAYNLSWLPRDPRTQELRNRARYEPELQAHDDLDGRRIDWRKDLTLFERNEIPFRRKLRRLAVYATDPEFRLPKSVKDELCEELLAAINSDDYEHEDLEPAYARWVPEQLAQKWLDNLREVDVEIDYETGTDAEEESEEFREHQEELRMLHAWAHHHRHLLPLLELQDLEALQRAWKRHVKKSPEVRRLQHRTVAKISTEIGLLRALLSIAKPDTCVELIIRRPATEGPTSECVRVLPMSLSREQYGVCWTELLRRPDQELIDKIQLLSLEEHELDEKVIDRLVSLAKADREWAGEIASFAQLAESIPLMKMLIQEKVGLMLEWVSNHYKTNYVISAEISIEHLLRSASPGFVSGILDGRSDTDYRHFARVLPEFVRDGKSDWSWFHPHHSNPRTRWRFSDEAVEKALRLEPAILEELMVLSEDQKEQGCSPLQHSHNLYVAVCNALLRSAESQLGLELLDRLLWVERGSRFLGAKTTRPSREAFRLLVKNWSISEVAERLETAVDTITDDESLQELALLFPPGEDDWLWQKIERDAESGRELFLARSFTLAGFAHDAERGKEFLAGFGETLTDWIANVRAKSLASAERALQARFWFNEFLDRKHGGESWAAFRLFIRCLDRRFSHWYLSALKEAGLRWSSRDSKMVFLRANFSMINTLIKEDRKKKIKDHFCHTKISKGIIPWMGGWTYPVEFDRELISGQQK